MRKINYLVLHCTATPQNTTIASILNYWRTSLGWKNPGYHYIIKPNGQVVNLLPIEQVANGVKGFNSVSIHISYIGGVDAKGRGLDNRTEAQKAAQIMLLKKFKGMFPDAEIKGHRDFPNVQKECPSFDVRTWLKTITLLLFLFLSSCAAKKTLRQEKSITEQKTLVSTETKSGAQEVSEKRAAIQVVKTDSTRIKLYGFQGNISANKISGRVDSAEIETRSLKQTKRQDTSKKIYADSNYTARDSLTSNVLASAFVQKQVERPPWRWTYTVPILLIIIISFTIYYKTR